MRAAYEDILRVWREADAIPAIEHAWLWDHFLPLFRDPSEPVHEGWTLLAALAGQTRRLRLGLMVTTTALAPPAVLAKMAATVDVISGGRLVFGIGVGGTRQPANVDNPAVREYAAYGLPLVSPAGGPPPPAHLRPPRRARVRALRPAVGLAGGGHRPPRRDLHDRPPALDGRGVRLRGTPLPPFRRALSTHAEAGARPGATGRRGGPP